MELNADTGAGVVRAATAAVLTHGAEVKSRHGDALELSGVTLRVSTPARTLVQRDGFDPAIAAAEALHLISGTKYGPRIAALTAHLGSNRWQPGKPSAATRLRGQLPVAVWKLEAEPGTRQVYLPLAVAGDLEHGLSDYLCATGVQFLIRGGDLEAVVGWRSSDVWHGLPYNLFAWGQLQVTLARALGVGAGALTFAVGSLHLYGRHTPDAVRAVAVSPYPERRYYGVGQRASWAEAVLRATMLLEGPGPFDPSETEAALARLLG